MMKPKEYRAQLAESFAHVLEEKQLEWKEKWQVSGMAASPVNGKSGHVYRGINRFFLMFTALERGYQDNRWCTFNQIKDKGWKLVNAKGQGVKVEYWFPYDREEKRSVTWDEFQKTGGIFGERYFLRAVYKTVFNASLIEGIPELIVPEPKEISPDELIEKLSVNMGVEIINDGGNRAFYRPSEDKIHLPSLEYFESEYAYDSTALHELAHATGAPHRLNRDLKGGFGSPEYAYEELIAEISACFMSANLHVEQSGKHVDNHKAYVQSWIQAIREKPETLVKAIQQAEKTASYMEYKAELIELEEYERVVGASIGVEQKNILPPVMIANEGQVAGKQGTRSAEMDSFKPKNRNMDNWHVIEEKSEYVLYHAGEEVLRGDAEEIQSAEERIQLAGENGNVVGDALRKVRIAQGYTVEQIADIALISDKELQLIESGELYPDKMTLQIISNICKVYSENLENGQIVPKKTRQELNTIIQDIKENLKEIREDTHALRKFAEKYGIPVPEIKEQLSNQEEYYVVEDRKTGEVLANAEGEEIRMESQIEAEQIASELNDVEQRLSMAEELVREYETSIGRTDSVLGTYSEEQVITYAAMCQRYLTFGKSVDDCLNHMLTRREAIKVCDTPAIFIEAGCKELPMHITQRHIRLCMHEMVAENVHYHGLTREEIKRIPEALDNPAIIAESISRKDSLVVVLGYREQNGLPVLLSVVPEGKAFYNLETVNSNFITSVYGKDNIEKFVGRLAEQGKILYVNKEKSEELALVPLQLRQDHPVPAYNRIIRQMGESVNENLEDKGAEEAFLKAEKVLVRSEAQAKSVKEPDAPKL